MRFELKNAGATFQRMVNKIFKDLIGNIMEAYVDDMLIKIVQRTNHLQHLNKAFDLLRQYEVKFNPEKCTFRVASGKFLGYFGHLKGHRDRRQPNISNSKHEVTHLYERGSDAERTSCCPQSVHQPIHRQMKVVLPSLE